MALHCRPFSLGAFNAFYQESRQQRGVYCYHAHTYFPLTAAGRASAVAFKLAWQKEFEGTEAVIFGDLQDYLSGPHTRGNFETAFTRDVYGDVVMWLQQHRPSGLNILLHPFTLNTVADHTDFAAWLGKPLSMNLDSLERADEQFAQRSAGGETEAHIIWKAACDLNAHVKEVAQD